MTRMKRNQRMYWGIFLLSVLFSAFYLAIRRGAGLEGFIYEGGKQLFMDFINNLHYPTHEGGPYFDSIWASFPPLAYTFYYLLNVGYTRAIWVYEILAYTMLTAASVAVMLYAVQRILRRYQAGAGVSLLLTLCVLLSGIGIFTVERGNSVFNVMVMLLLAMAIRDSDNRWQREAALLLIAVAANFKIYPCLFGLLYLLEKRYKEALRLVIYGVVLFVVPFAWFGGLEGFKAFLSNQMGIHNMLRDNYLTSIPSVAVFLSAEFAWNAQSAELVGKIIAYAYLAVSLVCVCLTKKLWMRCLLFVNISTLVPEWSCEYMAIYYAIPLALFLFDERQHEQRLSGLYTALFAGVFILLPFGVRAFTLHSGVSWNMLVSFACVYIMSIVAMVDIIITAINQRKARLAG